MYDKETLYKKRDQVRKLHSEKHLNKTEIAKQVGITWNFVHKWTKDPAAPIHDQRGWPQGKRRSRTNEEELRVIMIRKQLQDSGFGLIFSLVILSANGEIKRFSHPKKLVGYAGLGAGMHDSGKKHQSKSITNTEGTQSARAARSCAGLW